MVKSRSKQSMEQFLNTKVYGQPFMPRNYAELLAYIQLQIYYYVPIYLTYFKVQYLSSYWGLLYILRDVSFSYMIYYYTLKSLSTIYHYGPFGIVYLTYQFIIKTVYKVILNLPPIKAKIDKELAKTINKIDHQVVLNDTALLQFPTLPPKGISNVEVLQELDKHQLLKHSEWHKGRVSGAVYHGGDDLLELQSDAYTKYSIANQLHPDVFPGIRKMESEIVSMVLNLFNAPPGACGSTTSGGTESLLLAGLAAREYGKKYKGISRPEIIAPVTVHAGIDKACYYFGMKLHKVALDANYKVDVSKVKRLVNKNTVLLVGSAPNYPHGIIDDIEALSKLALNYNIPLHVDCCLGSFIVPFLQNLYNNQQVPLFDFRLDGVSSISCDTHKYGFAPKGSSIIMYRHDKLRKCQYYVSSDWVGGMYGSPTLAGSRPGALMAGCWATLIHIGQEGYFQYAQDIVHAAMKFKTAIRTHPVLSQHLEVIGEPISSVIAFKSKASMNIYGLSDTLTSNGWHFSTLQNPPALHFAFTKLTVSIVDDLIDTLVKCTIETIDNKQEISSDTASLYGIAGNVLTAGVADRIVVGFLDALYKL